MTIRPTDPDGTAPNDTAPNDTDLDDTHLDAHFRRPRLVTRKPRTETPDRRLALRSVLPQRTAWAEQLMTVLRAEVHAAVGRGVISTGESEQLLARLSLVIDQAIATR